MNCYYKNKTKLKQLIIIMTLLIILIINFKEEAPAQVSWYSLPHQWWHRSWSDAATPIFFIIKIKKIKNLNKVLQDHEDVVVCGCSWVAQRLKDSQHGDQMSTLCSFNPVQDWTVAVWGMGVTEHAESQTSK